MCNAAFEFSCKCDVKVDWVTKLQSTGLEQEFTTLNYSGYPIGS